MNYKSKRNRVGLSAYTVAKELGIDYRTYLEVDNGKRPLEGEYIDKFMNILNNAKEIKFNRLERMKKINEWFDSGKALERCREYGFSGASLGRELGLTQGCISMAINPDNKYHYMTGDDTKEIIYDFLTNPFNKKIIIENKKVNNKIENDLVNNDKSFVEMNNWYKNTNISYEIIKKYGSIPKFAKFVGISSTHIYNVLNGNKNASDKMIRKLYDLLHSENDNNEEVETFEYVEPTTPNVEEQTNTNNDTENEIENSVQEVEKEDNVVEIKVEPKEKDIITVSKDSVIRNLQEENERLRRQIMLYEKLIERL